MKRKLHLVSFLPVLTHDRFSLHLLKMATLPEKMLYIVLVLEFEKRDAGGRDFLHHAGQRASSHI